MTSQKPARLRLSTTEARTRLSDLVRRVQDPRAYVVLTRHDQPVAALVSMAELNRIWKQQDIEDITEHGARPARFTFGRGFLSNGEAAEAIQKMQMDRLMEREVLAKAGLKPVPGGELTEPVDFALDTTTRPRRWWQIWRRTV